MTNAQRLKTLDAIRKQAEAMRDGLTPESELDYLLASIEAKCEDATVEIHDEAAKRRASVSADAFLLALQSGDFTINGKRPARA